MIPLRALTKGLRTLFRKSAAERDLDDEVRHFLEMAVEEKMRTGLSRGAAERAARLDLGGVEPLKEDVRNARWETALESVARDVQYAVRALRRNPVYATVATLTLALGIGANTAMFSVVNAVLLRPLPYPAADRLVMIWTDDARRGLHREATAYRTILDWRSGGRTLEEVAFFSTERAAPLGNDPGSPRQRTRSAFVSGNLFSVLRVPPAHGRAITAADEAGGAQVVVISHAFWLRHFNEAPDVLGRTVVLDGASRGGNATLTVVGVMPPGFYFPDKLTDLWTPATTYWRFQRESTERFPAWARRWTAIGRLAPDASVTAARADLARIGTRLTGDFPPTVPDFPGFGATVLPILDVVAGRDLQSSLWLLLGAVGIVLLTACANVANLMLARGAAREREFAVRRALGASRARLVRQLACESLTLSFVGGLAGLGVVVWTTNLLATVAARYLPRGDELTIDGRVLAFALGVSVVAGLAFGAAPAFRLSSAATTRGLRDGGRGTAGAGIRRHHGALVLAECALAMVLLAGAGLLVKSLLTVRAIDPGFDPRNVLTLRLEYPSEAPPTAEERTQTSEIAPMRARARDQRVSSLLERIEQVSGVERVGITDDLFIGGQGNETITIPGRDPGSIAAGELNEAIVSPGFFTTLRVPLRRGRVLTREDTGQKIQALWSPVVTHLSLDEKARRATPEPVVVNEAFAARFFGGEDPIGKRFCVDPTNKTYWYVIVGVVGDMHRQGLERHAMPEYYGPYLASPNGRADLLVRTTGDPLAVAATVRRLVTEAIPGVTLVTTSTADAQFDGFTAQRRLQTWLLGTFASLGLLLAAIGIFGLVHYGVTERTRELGVRIALGATPGQLMRLVVWHGMRMPLAGIVVGLVASLGVTRVLSGLLFHVGTTDPPTFAIVAGALTMVALAACCIPAHRAARIDPIRALRQE